MLTDTGRIVKPTKHCDAVYTVWLEYRRIHPWPLKLNWFNWDKCMDKLFRPWFYVDVNIHFRQRFNYTVAEVRAWMSNYISMFYMDVITYPRPKISVANQSQPVRTLYVGGCFFKFLSTFRSIIFIITIFRTKSFQMLLTCTTWYESWSNWKSVKKIEI